MSNKNNHPNTKEKKTKELTDHERIAAVAMLIGMARNSDLLHGSLTEVAKNLMFTRKQSCSFGRVVLPCIQQEDQLMKCFPGSMREEETSIGM